MVTSRFQRNEMKVKNTISIGKSRKKEIGLRFFILFDDLSFNCHCMEMLSDY